MNQFQQAKRRKKLAEQVLRLEPGAFTPIDLFTTPFIPKGMTRAFRNNRYVVMIYDGAETTHGKAIQVLVQRHDDTSIPRHWAEMQKIKNEIFGEETVAVEYYPKESELVNAHNIYWLWIYPDGVLPKPILKKENEPTN